MGTADLLAIKQFLMRSYGEGKNEHFNQCFHEIYLYKKKEAQRAT